MKLIPFRRAVTASIIGIAYTFSSMYATQTVVIPSAVSTIPVLAKVLDRATGTLYLGFDGGAANYSLSKVYRPSGLVQPTLATVSSSFAIDRISALALAAPEGYTKPNIAFVSGPVSTAAIGIINNAGTITQSISSIIGFDLSTATPSAIAANNCYIFAGLLSTNGIAVISINPTTLALVQTAAQPGSDAVRARQLNSSTPEVGINFTIRDDYKLVWDNPLQRLYIGDSVKTSTAFDGYARTVVVARPKCGVLYYSPIFPDAIFFEGELTPEDYIIATNSIGTTQALYRHAILHASTGPSYLIVNGGQTAPDDLKLNRIYALPLVDVPNNEVIQGTLADPYAPLVAHKFIDPAVSIAQLTTASDPFAQVGAGPLHFDSVAQAISDMVVVGDTVYVTTFNTQNTENETGVFYSQAIFDSEGKIARWTPWTKRAFPIGGISDTACPCRVKFFDVDAVTGKLWGIGGSQINTIATTAWDHGTRCCCPQPVTSPCEPCPHQITPLVIRLNQTLCACCAPCYSALDLDASTRGFSYTNSQDGTPYRYALFGGNEKVAFALISDQLYTGVQEVVQDFSLPENFALTLLPRGAGCVTCLEYARRVSSANPAIDEGISNYFFAGTATGLYVFVNNEALLHSGFAASALTTLNLPPFINGQWIPAPNIPGAIIDIKTTGQALYVLTRETSCNQPYKCTLYRIGYQNTVEAMFDPSHPENFAIIAQTGVGIFEPVQLFTGIQIVVSGVNVAEPLPSFRGTTEQVVLTTNNGIYQTTTINSAHNATSQTDAGWTQLDTEHDRLYKGIAGMDNAPIGIFPPDAPLPSAELVSYPATVWPFSLDTTKCCGKTYQRSSIFQLSCTTSIVTESAIDLPTVALCEFEPEHFNDNLHCFKSLLPINYFWTDGARRFFIVHNTKCANGRTQLMVSPFNIKEWNVWNPDQLVITDPPISTVCDFYWVRHIGVTGIVMAGTSQGVVALE